MKKKAPFLLILLGMSFLSILWINPSIKAQKSKSWRYFEYPTETWLIERQDYFGEFIEWNFIPVNGQHSEKRIWNFTWQFKYENPISEIREALDNQTRLKEIYNQTPPFQFKNLGDFLSDVSRLDRYPVEPEDKEEFGGIFTIDILNNNHGIFEISFKDKWKPGKRIHIGFSSTITYSSSTDTLTYTGGNETSPVTFWDLWNASYVNNWNVSDQISSNSSYGIGFQNMSYIFISKIQGGDGSTDTWFATERETIIFTKDVYQALYLFGGYSTIKSHFRMGNLDANGEPFNGSTLIFDVDSWTNQFGAYNADTKFYDSTIIYSGSGQVIWALGEIDIKRSSFHGGNGEPNYFTVKAPNTQIDGLEIYSSQFLPQATPNYIWKDIYILGDEYIAFHPHYANPIVVNNLRVSDVITHQFQIYGNANCTLINPIVDWAKIIFEAPINNEQWWIRYSFQVNVTDCCGSPIENANVTVSHYGTEFKQDFSVLTWANGTHEPQNLLYMKLNATTRGNGGGSTPYYMNPYNIKIEKEGYATCNFNFTLSGKTFQCVALESLKEYPFGLNFDGVDDYVSVSHDESLNFGTSDFTLEAWVKLNPTSEGDQIIYKGDSGWNTLYTLGVNPITNPFFYFGVYEDGVGTSEVHSTTLANGEWQHIVGVRNGSTIRIYINGKLEDTQGGVIENPDTTNNLLLGIDALEVAPFKGIIDEVRIYNRVLNQTEISYSYNNHYGIYTPLNQSGLVAWYHFDEGSGTKILDETKNNNDGILYGDTDEWVLGKIEAIKASYGLGLGSGFILAFILSMALLVLGALAISRRRS